MIQGVIQSFLFPNQKKNFLLRALFITDPMPSTTSFLTGFPVPNNN